MKLKCRPEDFVVDEETSTQPGSRGRHALYRLRKRSVTTLEAMEAIQRHWRLAGRRISRGGLKDRYAVTSQLFSVLDGPRRGLELDGVSVDYLGQLPEAFGPEQIAGNRFRVVVRDLDEESAVRAEAAASDVALAGVPNYFDNQRFGSIGESGEFIAVAWLKEDYERALWLAFAEPREEDRATEASQKEILRGHWGDWAECKRLLERSHRRSIVTFLADRPGDFKGAWARVNRELRSLYLSAWQSRVFNEVLAELVRDAASGEGVVPVPLRSGEILFPRDNGPLRGGLRERVLPLPSTRLKHEVADDADLQEKYARGLAAWGVSMDSLRIRSPKDCFLSKGRRAAVVHPTGMRAETRADEMHAGRHLVELSFGLGRGSYATIVIKRLFEIR